MSRRPSEESKPIIPNQRIKIASLGIALPSAWARSIIKIAELNQSSSAFNIPMNNLSRSIRLVVLPILPLLSALPLQYEENKEIMSRTASWTEGSCSYIKWRFRKQPISSFLTLIGAMTEALICANSLFYLDEELSQHWPGLLLASSLGIVDALQYILLEGQALSDRMNTGLIYQDNQFNEALRKKSLFKKISYLTLIHFIPIIGVLLYSGLAFVNCRDLIERLNTSSDPNYRQDIGDIVGAFLAIIYGGMQYPLYGYRIQEIITTQLARRMGIHQTSASEEIDEKGHIVVLPRPALQEQKCSNLLTLLATSGSFAESVMVIGSTIMFYNAWAGTMPNIDVLVWMSIVAGGIAGIENFLVDGRALRDIFKHHDKKQIKHIQKSTRYKFSEFISDLSRIAVLTFTRAMIQRYLIPNTADADNLDSRITVSSYVFTTLASVLTWLIFSELRPLLRSQKFHIQLLKKSLSPIENKQETIEIDEANDEITHNNKPGFIMRSCCPRSKLREEDISLLPSKIHPSINRAGVFSDKNIEIYNKQATQLYTRQTRNYDFRRSRSRLITQGILQFFIPVIIGSVLETQFYNFFQDHTDLERDQKLHNAQVMGAFFISLVAVLISHLLNRLWRCYDDREADKIYYAYQYGEQSRLKKEIDMMNDMTYGVRGYTTEVFNSLILNQTKKSSHIDFVRLNILPPMIHHTAESKTNVPLLAYAFTMEHIDSKKENWQSISDHEVQEKMCNAFKGVLENQRVLLVPFCYKISSQYSELEEFGLLYAYKDGDKIVVNYYSPTNNFTSDILLQNLLAPIGDQLKWQSTKTRTPCNIIDSGTWVIAQIQAIVANHSQLARNPYQLENSRNYSTLRFKQLLTFTSLQSDHKQSKPQGDEPIYENEDEEKSKLYQSLSATRVT